MREEYKLVKCDFHLHTHYSDNKEKMTITDYCHLAKQRNMHILGIGDHHHNLTQEKWRALKEEIINADNENVIVISGYEVTFADGHMVMIAKESFDGEYIDESIEQIYNSKNIRIMAHPDNNLCKWVMNLVPDINGIELVNGGQDIHSYHEESPCNGIKTYKEYLLLRHLIAPFGQSDCHERLFFGNVWTGFWIPKKQKIDIQNIKDVIHKGNTFSSFGQLEIEFYSENNIIMGDSLWSDGNKKIFWKVPEGTQVTIYYGDIPIDSYNDEKGNFTPNMNGPFWIFAQKGNTWAVSAPIWVKGISQESKIIELKKKQCFNNGIMTELNEKVETLLQAVKSLRENNKSLPIPTKLYIEWIEKFLLKNIHNGEFVNKSMQTILLENQRRLKVCARILRHLMYDLLRYIQKENKCIQNELWIYNFSKHKIDRIIKANIIMPREINDFYLTTAEGKEVNFVYTQLPRRREPVNEYRNGERMLEIITWLNRGEMHEFQILNVELKEEKETLFVSFDLYPREMVCDKVTWEKQARAIEEYINNETFKHYHLHARTLNEYSLLIDTLWFYDDIKNILLIHQGNGLIERKQKALNVYSQFNNDTNYPDLIFTVHNYIGKY